MAKKMTNMMKNDANIKFSDFSIITRINSEAEFCKENLALFCIPSTVKKDPNSESLVDDFNKTKKIVKLFYYSHPQIYSSSYSNSKENSIENMKIAISCLKDFIAERYSPEISSQFSAFADHFAVEIQGEVESGVVDSSNWLNNWKPKALESSKKQKKLQQFMLYNELSKNKPISPFFEYLMNHDTKNIYFPENPNDEKDNFEEISKHCRIFSELHEIFNDLNGDNYYNQIGLFCNKLEDEFDINFQAAIQKDDVSIKNAFLGQNSFISLMNNLILKQNPENSSENSEDSVKILTAHSAKG